jgi:hypothetical protein
MAIPIKVVRGQTAVFKTTVEIADVAARRRVLHDVVPAKIPDAQPLFQTEHSVVLLTPVSLGTVLSFVCLRAQTPFQVSINGSWTEVKFIQFCGNAAISIKGVNATPVRVTCIYS